jgi:hypothetical protein
VSGYGAIVKTVPSVVRQYVARPPEMSKTPPVEKERSPLLSHATRAATSGTVPNRFMGIFDSIIAGDHVGQLALALGQGQNVPNNSYYTPVACISQSQAASAHADLRAMDQKAIALLGQYGG